MKSKPFECFIVNLYFIRYLLMKRLPLSMSHAWKDFFSLLRSFGESKSFFFIYKEERKSLRFIRPKKKDELHTYRHQHLPRTFFITWEIYFENLVNFIKL